MTFRRRNVSFIRCFQQLFSIVKANQSNSAKTKARKKRTLNDFPVHSFQTLLADLGIIAKNQIESSVKGANFIFAG